MNNYTFDNFTRINKTAARKLYEAGESFYMCPVKLRPGKPWHPEVLITPDPSDEYRSFEKDLNSFEYYNCNSYAGQYTAFYSKGNKASKGKEN